MINLTKNSISKSFYSIYFKLIQEILVNKFNQEFNNTKNDFNIEFENIESTLLYTLKESLKKIVTSESILSINDLDFNNIKNIFKDIEKEVKKNNNIEQVIKDFKNEFNDIRNRKINKDLINKLKLGFEKHIFFKLSQCFQELLKKIFQNNIFKNLDSKISHSQIYELIENNIQNFNDELK